MAATEFPRRGRGRPKGEPSAVTVAGDVAYVSLSQNKIAIVDAADAALVRNHRWFAVRSGRTFYASRSQTVNGRQRDVRMHRDLLGPDCGLIDHKDGDGLNNRRGNLRPATPAQNNQNTRLRKDNQSGFKGVSKHGGRWSAKITVSGTSRYLGLYATPEAASAAYCRASKELHGEYGRTG